MTSSDGVGILDADRLLKEWRWLCPMRVTIIDCNAYGDLFVRDDLGRIHMPNQRLSSTSSRPHPRNEKSGLRRRTRMMLLSGV